MLRSIKFLQRCQAQNKSMSFLGFFCGDAGAYCAGGLPQEAPKE